MLNSAKKIASNTVRQTNQSMKNTVGYESFTTPLRKYIYKESEYNKNTPEGVVVETFNEKAQRIYVTGYQKEALLIEINKIVQKENSFPGMVSEELKDASEIAHYALEYKIPVRLAHVKKICPKMDLSMFPIVDESEYNECVRKGIDFAKAYHKPYSNREEYVIDIEEDLTSERAEDVKVKSHDTFREFSKSGKKTNDSKDFKQKSQEKSGGKGPNDSKGKNESGGRDRDTDAKSIYDSDKFEYDSKISPDSKHWDVFKEGIHHDNLREEFKVDENTLGGGGKTNKP